MSTVILDEPSAVASTMDSSGKLERLCELRGKSRNDVITATNTPRATVHRWFSGTSEPSIEKLAVLAKFFGVSVDYLCTNQEDGPVNVRPVTEAEEQILRRVKIIGAERAIRRLMALPETRDLEERPPGTATEPKELR